MYGSADLDKHLDDWIWAQSNHPHRELHLCRRSAHWTGLPARLHLQFIGRILVHDQHRNHKHLHDFLLRADGYLQQVLHQQHPTRPPLLLLEQALPAIRFQWVFLTLQLPRRQSESLLSQSNRLQHQSIHHWIEGSLRFQLSSIDHCLESATH